MEMHQIRYFLAVAETLNFTRAAEDCHVAQPSLSRAIRKLEEELGGDLFRRERSRTHLTDLGRAMLPLLRQAFESAAAAKEQATHYYSLERAPLRMGISLTVQLDLIAPMLVELSKTFPGLELRLVRAAAPDILAALEAGDIELGIAADANANWDRLDYWPLFEEGFVVLAPPDPQRTGATLAQLVEGAVIARPYCETLAVPDEAIAGDGEPRQRHEVASDEDAARLARGGIGIAVLPESSGRRLSESAMRPDDLRHTRTVRAYSVAGRQRSTTASALLRLLRAADWAEIA